MTIIDTTPDHLKFGYAAMLEKRAIRERLALEGVAGMSLHFAVEAAYIKAHANDPTYREISARFSERCRSGQRGGVYVIFTQEELAHIVEHFDGANDPLPLAIAVKASAALECVGLKADVGDAST